MTLFVGVRWRINILPNYLVTSLQSLFQSLSIIFRQIAGQFCLCRAHPPCSFGLFFRRMCSSFKVANFPGLRAERPPAEDVRLIDALQKKFVERRFGFEAEKCRWKFVLQELLRNIAKVIGGLVHRRARLLTFHRDRYWSASLVSEEQHLFVCKQQTDEKCKICTHLDQAANVQLLFESLTDFVHLSQLTVFAANEGRVEQCLAVRDPMASDLADLLNQRFHFFVLQPWLVA